ncbi:STAS domain-containing protein [Thalassotalea sp. M1531]|uniref:STAS domain-containing protein n=2 Tax=Thalassotalea algicola TaxID=2716224 RepID=A0A7Y0LBQ6_9GAMM|nr:STAS domain-containing protein [Thalassotalea algicola]
MFKLPAELTIAKAEAFKQILMEYVADHDSIVIDDSEVEKIDTIGVQLLIAMITYLISINKNIEWQCKAEIIKESVIKLGINEPILSQYFDNE